MCIPLDIVVVQLLQVITFTSSPCPGSFQSFLNMDKVVLIISKMIFWELESFQISFLFVSHQNLSLIQLLKNFDSYILR